jgi:hypothetical protein
MIPRIVEEWNGIDSSVILAMLQDWGLWKKNL